MFSWSIKELSKFWNIFKTYKIQDLSNKSAYIIQEMPTPDTSGNMIS